MNNNRKPNQSRIRRTVAAVLIVAALVVVMGVALVMQCLSFDDDGAHVIDRYGVLAMENQTQQPVDSGSAQPAEPQPEPDEPEKTEPEAETPAATRALLASAGTVADESSRSELLSLAQAGRLDTVIVTIKDEEGNLNIHVDTEEIADTDYLVDSGADALEAGIAALKDAGVHVVGRIYCMHDQKGTGQNSDMAMQFERGGTWLDYDNTRWLDPTNDDAVGYLCDIAHAAVQAGCDELMLADYTFPPRGHLDRVAFDSEPESQAAVLTEALADIRQVCGEATISLTADSADALTGLSANGVEDGIPLGDVSALLGAANRLFVPAADAAEAAAITAAVQAAAPNANVVPMFDSMETWQAYTGDAVLDAGADMIQTLAAP